jgi:hypothetical protein
MRGVNIGRKTSNTFWAHRRNARAVRRGRFLVHGGKVGVLGVPRLIKRTVIDGPFRRNQGVGRRLLDSPSEVEGMIKHCPNPMNEDDEIEIRQMFELEDFGDSEAVEQHRKPGEAMARKEIARRRPRIDAAASARTSCAGRSVAIQPLSPIRLS